MRMRMSVEKERERITVLHILLDEMERSLKFIECYVVGAVFESGRGNMRQAENLTQLLVKLRCEILRG
jgi:hypothetical protein